MRTNIKTIVAGGIAASVLTVGALAGVARAQSGGGQTQPASPTPRPGQQQRQQRIDEQLDRLAKNLGTTTDKLKGALKQTALEEVQAAQDAGRLTPEQAQRARDAINSGDPGRLGLGFGFGGPGFGPGKGGPRDGIGRGFFAGGQELAGFLGIPEDQLRTELRDSSLADVAAKHNKTRDDLKKFLTDAMNQRLSDAVTNGRLTQAQADTARTAFTNNLDQMIDAKRGAGMPGLGPRRSGTPHAGQGQSN